ncbi:MAG: type II toxin-antitoxin system ParD family antitoxin [Sulfitobacter sp.]|nr:type II toxin-antitoxin system ParD family antitoxin [Sulfitobacter sp.]
MATRNVVLTDHQDKLIDSLVASGRFQNASEALRAGLRLLEEEEAELLQIREGLWESLAQADRREFTEGTPEEIFEKAFDEAKARHGL